MSFDISVRQHQREWCSDGPPEARNQPDWRTTKDEHPGKRARVCQQDDYFTPMEPTQLKIKRPPSPALSCPGVTSVTSERDLTPGQRKYPNFKVKKRTRVEKIEEKKPIRTGQQHSADQCPEIKALLTGWPLIELFPEPIRCEDFDFSRCLYECLHQRDIHRWPAHKDQLVYGPVLNGSNVSYPMDQFCCYYCVFGSESFQCVVDHSINTHSEQILKVRSRELNIYSGKLGYRTHNFLIHPKLVHDKHQLVVVKNDEPGNLQIHIIGKSDADKHLFETMRSPLAKKAKSENHVLSSVSSPGKNDDFVLDMDFQELVDDNINVKVKEDDDVHYLVQQMPLVLQTMRKHGHEELWKKFHKMIAEDNFPMDNIAYLLFLDVVRWYASENTVSMRYDDKVSKFWRVGYKLFHGRFLRFMSGPKHRGQVIQESKKGFFEPIDSGVNFAVPVQKVTKGMRGPTLPENIKPGILNHLLGLLTAGSDNKKTYKLCLDGKKINASTSGILGDIDLFGHEQKPTLNERQERLNKETALTSDILAGLEKFEPDTALSSLLPSSFPGIHEKMKKLITLLGNRLQDLRSIKLSRERALAKFKDQAGSNWRNSSLCNVISAISTHLYDVNMCIRDTLSLVDKICHACSILQKSQANFRQDKRVDLNIQPNYRHLSTMEGFSFNEEKYRLMKQQSPQWYEIRKNAVATGSSLNSSIGLDTLKKQQEHYDYVKFGKEKPEPSAQVKEKMEYGRSNEINAVATLVAKVLPSMFPGVSFSEEGCVKIRLRESHIIVSPDGSCLDTISGVTTMAVEIKCPFPPNPNTCKAKLPVYYKIPKYYVPQILAEMQALETNNLLFLCYSKESTVVLNATFDQELWQCIIYEVESTYGPHAVRPKRKSQNVNTLHKKIESYIEEKVDFLGEFVSVLGNQCSGKDGNINDPYCEHTDSHSQACNLRVFDVNEYVFESKHMFQNAYRLCRQRATEFLGFMVSDLDRIASPTHTYSVPVAFAMKGYSLPTDILREMIEHVLVECAAAGLYVPVCSFDGQWYRITVRDQNDYPLSVLQLQKEVYHEVKRLPMNELLWKITTKNVVKCSTVEDLLELTNVTQNQSQITVASKQDSATLKVTSNITRMITAWKCGKSRATPNDSISNPLVECIGSTLTSLPPDVVESIPLDTLNASRFNSETEQSSGSNYSASIITNAFIESPYEEDMSVNSTNLVGCVPEPDSTLTNIDDHDMINAFHEMHLPSQSGNSYCNGILNENEIKSMQTSLKYSTRSKKSWDMPLELFSNLFNNAQKINTTFTKNDLLDAIAPVAGKLASQGIKINTSTAKRHIVTKLCAILGDGSTLPEVTKKVKKSPKSLSMLAKNVVAKFPKDILTALHAENIFSDRLEDWFYNNPFGKRINIESLSYIGKWYSMPEYNSKTGNYIFMILDSYHQLCGLRRLVCQHGIPSRGVHKSAFVKIAKESESNKCGLNLAMVNDLIDKQSADFARATFSTKVSTALENIGANEEALFCTLVNNWYRAEDDPGISAIDRCRYRLAFRDWLLKDVSFQTFPPYGAYIKDIPIVLFEGLLTNLERKIQLFTFTKTGSYNVRAVGSLDIENFFGTFQDIDPKGTGVIRPDDIPTALRVATELIDAKFDPNRGFHMETTAACKVYPIKQQLSACDNGSNSSTNEESIWRDLTSISPVDHQFDLIERTRCKPKRKSAGVSKPDNPGRGCLPVRQFHKRDETKILPHVRRGLILDDI